MRKKGVVTIPQEIREQFDLHEGDHLVVTVEDGRIVLIPASIIPKDQAWFWTPEWQAKEREVDEAIARGGKGVVFENGGDMLKALSEMTGVSLDDIDPDRVR